MRFSATNGGRAYFNILIGSSPRVEFHVGPEGKFQLDIWRMFSQIYLSFGSRCPPECPVLKGADSQLVVSVCQHTLVGSAAERLFIGQQPSSEKLLSCADKQGTFALVYLGVCLGVRYAVYVLVMRKIQDSGLLLGVRVWACWGKFLDPSLEAGSG